MINISTIERSIEETKVSMRVPIGIMVCYMALEEAREVTNDMEPTLFGLRIYCNNNLSDNEYAIISQSFVYGPCADVNFGGE